MVEIPPSINILNTVVRYPKPNRSADAIAGVKRVTSPYKSGIKGTDCEGEQSLSCQGYTSTHSVVFHCHAVRQYSTQSLTLPFFAKAR